MWDQSNAAQSWVELRLPPQSTHRLRWMASTKMCSKYAIMDGEAFE